MEVRIRAGTDSGGGERADGEEVGRTGVGGNHQAGWMSDILNAVGLRPRVGPLAVAAFGSTREFATWPGPGGSPGDFGQTRSEQLSALLQGFNWTRERLQPPHLWHYATL